MIRIALSIAAPCLLLAAIAGAASAQIVIDDFEKQDFFVSQSGPGESNQTILMGPTIHCISMTRKVKAFVYAGETGGQNYTGLSTGVEIGDAVGINFVGYGTTTFDYQWNDPIDLTEGGTTDRIHVHLGSALNGSQLHLAIDDTLGFTNRYQTVTGPGIYTFHFANYEGRPTGAIRIRVSLNSMGNSGLYTLEDIRTARPGASGVNIVRDLSAIEWPPLLGTPLSYRTVVPGAAPIYTTDISMVECDNAGVTPDMSANLIQAPHGYGELAAVLVWWEDGGEDINYTRFEMSFDFSGVPGTSAEVYYPIIPNLGARSIGITTGLMVRDNSGLGIGTSSQIIILSTGRNQNVTFEEVSVTTHSAKNATIGGIDVVFNIKGSTVSVTDPLFEISVASDWSTSVPTGVAAPLSTHGDAWSALVATPNIFRAVTDIRAIRPAEPGTSIAIYDVAGRLQREIPLARGELAAQWDGRDGDGRPAPSGVYWARMEGADSGVPARTTKLILVK